MTKKQYKSMGFSIEFSVPATVEEFDKNAKREGACLDEANANVVYRALLPDFKDVLIHGRDEDKAAGITAFRGLEELLKFPRPTRDTGKKTESGEPILAYAGTESDYLDLVRGSLVKLGVTEAQLAKIAQEAANAVSFDASARERKPAQPKKLAAKFREGAAILLAGPNVKRFVADVKKALGEDLVLSGDKTKDTEAVGWAIKKMLDYKAQQELAKITG